MRITPLFAILLLLLFGSCGGPGQKIEKEVALKEVMAIQQQIVNIKLENFPATEFGSLKGQVKHLSLLTDSEGFYHIEVALPDRLITSYEKEIVFRQEMRGVAEIVTEDLRLLQRFFNQFKEVFKA